MREWTIVISYIIFSGSEGVDYNNPLYHILQELREWTIIIRYIIFSVSEAVDYSNPTIRAIISYFAGIDGVDYNNPLRHIFRK